MRRSVAVGVGLGLRARHHRAFLEQRPNLPWLEAHTENYFQPGGWDRHVLFTLRQDYAISLHGVGLGLGSANGFDLEHLRRIEALARDLEPCLISEHLSWSAVRGRSLNDLLPLPLSQSALDLLCQRVDQVQDCLQQPILLENVSTYLRYRVDAMSEADFLVALAKRTGCRILLDVNNLYVNQINHDESALDAMAVIAAQGPHLVGEIHLAGHHRDDDVAVDNHGSCVADPVWELYRIALQHFGNVPTLIEWDTNIPPLPVLLHEAAKAQAYLQASHPAPSSGGGTAQANPHPQTVDVATIQTAFAIGLTSLSTSDLDFFRGPLDQGMRRFARYRGNQVAICQKVLAAAYPVIKTLVGEEFFSAMAVEYNHAYPSKNGDLNEMGGDFPQFLAAFRHVAKYPYFPDVARLEWAVHRAFYAAEEPEPLDAHALATWSPEQLEAACFLLNPGCRVLESMWAIVDVWQAHQPESVELPEKLNAETYALVCRPGWEPKVLAISRPAHAALSVLAAGATFGAALDAALESDATFDVATHLRQWVELKLLSHSMGGDPPRDCF